MSNTESNIPPKPYQAIVTSCEGDLEKYGDNFRGVGWTKKQEYAELRYRIMLDAIRGSEPITLLDLGCGASHLLEHINREARTHIHYSGLDLSDAFLALSHSKFPMVTYYQEDILDPKHEVPNHDYVIMNGLFNWKGTMTHDEMWVYCKAMIRRAFQLADIGIAFNVMSKYLDWERDDLFHLPFDVLAQFLDGEISRHFTLRHDYGLFEYTVYVYKQPLQRMD